MPAIPDTRAPEINPIFLIGCWRSGTSILAKLVGSHPRIHWIGWEMNNEWEKLGGVKIQTDFRPYQSPQEVSHRSASRMAVFFHQELLKSYVQLKGGPVVPDEMFGWPFMVRPLNKSPNLMNKVAYLKTMFPRAHFILIVRDIYSFSNGLNKHLTNLVFNQRKQYSYWHDDNDAPDPRTFAHTHSLVHMSAQEAQAFPKDRLIPNPEAYRRIPEAWIKLNAGAIATLETYAKGDWHLVRFQDLMTDARSQLLSIWEFLGLPDVTLSLPDNLLEVDVSYNYTKTNEDPLNEYKGEMTDEQLSIIEAVREKFSSRVEFIETFTRQVTSPKPRQFAYAAL
jgi:Sulfotransferase family